MLTALSILRCVAGPQHVEAMGRPAPWGHPAVELRHQWRGGIILHACAITEA